MTIRIGLSARGYLARKLMNRAFVFSHKLFVKDLQSRFDIQRHRNGAQIVIAHCIRDHLAQKSFRLALERQVSHFKYCLMGRNGMGWADMSNEDPRYLLDLWQGSTDVSFNRWDRR